MLNTIITWNICLYVTLDICSNLHQCKFLYPFVGTRVINVTVIGLVPIKAAAAAAKSLQSCPTLCDPIDSSPPGSQSLGFSRQEHWSGLPFPSPIHESEKVQSLSRIRLFTTPWTAAHQAPLSMDFPGKSTGVGCHCLLLLSKQVIINAYAPCCHTWFLLVCISESQIFYQNRAITNSHVYYAF